MRIKLFNLVFLLISFQGIAQADFQIDFDTSTSHTSVTTLKYTTGFEPKAVIMFGGTRTADGISSLSYGNGYGTWIGFTTGSSNNYCVASAAQGRTGDVSSSSHVLDVDDSFCTYHRFGMYAKGELSSFASDGFIMNFDTASASGYQFGWLAIGGSDVSVASGTITEASTASTDYSVAGLSFQPDLVFLLYRNSTGTTTGTTTWQFGFGAGSGASNESSIYLGGVDGVTYFASTAMRNLDSSYIMKTTSTSSSTTVTNSELKSLNSDGFTLTRVTDDTNDRTIFYLAIGGIKAHVAKFTSETDSSGSEAYTGVGFQPSALFTAHARTTAGSASNHHVQGFGGAGSSTDDFSVIHGYALIDYYGYNSIGTDSDEFYSNSYGAASPAYTEQGSISTFDSDGFTVTYGVTSASAMEIIGVSIAADPPAASGPKKGAVITVS